MFVLQTGNSKVLSVNDKQMMNNDMCPGQGYLMGGPPQGWFPYNSNKDMRRGCGNKQMGLEDPAMGPGELHIQFYR